MTEPEPAAEASGVRKSSRLKNHKGIGKIDMIKSLIFFDTPSWLSGGEGKLGKGKHAKKVGLP